MEKPLDTLVKASTAGTHRMPEKMNGKSWAVYGSRREMMVKSIGCSQGWYPEGLGGHWTGNGHVGSGVSRERMTNMAPSCSLNDAGFRAERLCFVAHDRGCPQRIPLQDEIWRRH